MSLSGSHDSRGVWRTIAILGEDVNRIWSDPNVGLGTRPLAPAAPPPDPAAVGAASDPEPVAAAKPVSRPRPMARVKVASQPPAVTITSQSTRTAARPVRADAAQSPVARVQADTPRSPVRSAAQSVRYGDPDIVNQQAPPEHVHHHLKLKRVLRRTVSAAAVVVALGGAAAIHVSAAGNPNPGAQITEVMHDINPFHHYNELNDQMQFEAVIAHPQVHLIFWGSSVQSDTPGVSEQITQMVKEMDHSHLTQPLTQFHDVGTHFANDITLAGTWSDPSAPPPLISESDVANEIAHAAHVNGWERSANAVFVVVTPQSVHFTGAKAGFAGYHDVLQANDGKDYLGADVTATPVDGDGHTDTTRMVEHELVEAISDPNPNGASGWADSRGNEIGDGAENQVFIWNGFQVQKYWNPAQHHLSPVVQSSAPGEPPPSVTDAGLSVG